MIQIWLGQARVASGRIYSRDPDNANGYMIQDVLRIGSHLVEKTRQEGSHGAEDLDLNPGSLAW